jgi:NOL1/NOP2/fmu family ribosome biogenesis protein
MKYPSGKIQILNEKEKKRILRSLNEQFGIKRIPGVLVKRGAERIFLYQGSFNEEKIKEIERTLPLERVGVYFAKESNGEIRLSIEGTHLLQKQIKTNIFEIDKRLMEEWMHGSELNIQAEKKGFLVMKYQRFFLGCGKASKKKISNFIPKNRRLKRKD